MLAVLGAWILMIFVFISFGDMFLACYNKLCRQTEKYSILNTFLLGIPPLLVFLPLLHFVVPINSYVLLALVSVCILYWSFNVKQLLYSINRIINSLSIFNKVEMSILIALITSFLFIASWGVLNYDAGCYHYQFLRWIEDYPTVVGLGNIEERLGFNSNYFILSAPFTMRFLLAEPSLVLQGLLAVLISSWLLVELVRSEYSSKCILLFLLHLILVAVNILHFADSSTDVVPNQLVFYLIAYLTLYPQKWTSSPLLLITVPIAIVTLKLSLAVFALLSLVVIAVLMKGRKYRVIVFTTSVSTAIVVLWLIRNVILSGYLIFPMHELDFFSFDWKVPLDVALAERSFIKSGAIWQFKNLYNNAMTFFYSPELKYLNSYLIGGLFAIIALSIPYTIYAVYRKIVSGNTVVLYLIVFISTVACYVSAPDFRFSFGLIFGLVFIVISILFNEWTFVINISVKKMASLFLIVILLVHINYTFWELSNPFGIGDSKISMAIFKPRAFSEKNLIDGELTYKVEQIGDCVYLYVSNSHSGFTMYKAPAVPDDVNNRLGWRFQNYKNLEARGNSLRDGFRTNNDSK